MYEEKNIIPKPITIPEEKPKKKPPVNPSEIIGKIEISDTRERRDGPGGN